MSIILPVHPQTITAFAKNTICRKINDRLVLFFSDGSIITSRTPSPLLREGNVFELFPANAVTAIKACLNDTKRKKHMLSIDGTPALLYSSMSDFYNISALILPIDKALDPQQLFSLGETSFLFPLLSLSKNRFDKSTANVLCRHIAATAEYVGCIGHCECIFNALPRSDFFSPELFSLMCLFSVLTARNYGITRSFSSKIFQYNMHTVVNFSIPITSDTCICFADKYSINELNVCDRLAADKGTVFDCYKTDENECCLNISFIPEINPDDLARAAGIKEPFKMNLRNFVHKTVNFINLLT